MDTVAANHLEIAARAFAGQKAREITGEIVSLVLDRSQATIPDLQLIPQTENHIERRLTAWLKHCTVEFFQTYGKDMEERMLQMENLLRDKVYVEPMPPFIVRKDV